MLVLCVILSFHWKVPRAVTMKKPSFLGWLPYRRTTMGTGRHEGTCCLESMNLRVSPLLSSSQHPFARTVLLCHLYCYLVSIAFLLVYSLVIRRYSTPASLYGDSSICDGEKRSVGHRVRGLFSSKAWPLCSVK